MENVDSSEICEGKRGRGGEKQIREGVKGSGGGEEKNKSERV
jgi:hypothetical protein